MKFLADENVEKPIVDCLRQQGFDVRYVSEEVRSLKDDVILALANRENRILITNDKDFGEMAFRLHRARTGIFLLRFHRDDAEWKALRLAQFLEQYQQPLTGRFVVLRDARVRIRPLRG
jgi:predicted nuclease of predicted toxin-antitoxin system